MTTAVPRDGMTRRHIPRVDPRMRERRVAVVRAQGRRRLRVLLAITGVACVVGLAWVIVQSPLLAVEHVRVRGAQHTGADAVLHAAAVGEHVPVLLVDTGAIARRVEHLPWVARAVVHRDPPHALRIDVTERVMVAWVPAPAPATAVGLVDDTGRVVAVAPHAPRGLPEITGVPFVPAPGATIRPATLAHVLAPLPAGLRSEVRTVTGDAASATLVLQSGDAAQSPAGGGPTVSPPAADEVRLGPAVDLRAKGEAAWAVLQRLGAQHVRYVDVEVPSAPATG